MKIRQFLIEKTKREGLFYLFIESFFFKYQKMINFFKFGHIFRKIRIKKYIKTHNIKKLHIGAGKYHIKGFLNTDIFGRIPIDITKKLPFMDRSFNLIYSNHVIEHIYQKEFIFFLKESLRILKLAGIHIIQTPSLEKILKILYCQANTDKDIILKHHERTSRIKKIFPCNLINNIIHINYGHKYLYDFEIINYIAIKVGYREVKKIRNNYNLPDNELKSYLLENFKKIWDIETETYLLIK